MSELGLLDKLTVTFIVTEQCNLRCKYCYMLHKNSNNRMSFDVAKEAIDYLVGNTSEFPQKQVVWEFIGGEPLLEVDLIGQICDYIKLTTWEQNHNWFTNSWFNLSTNGVLYNDPKVQAVLNQYSSSFEVGITIDGTERMHDSQRQFSDGSGSHTIVVESVKQWLKRPGPISTKVTISHDNLSLLSEAILYLFSLGIPVVHANAVFEDVWQPGDDQLFEDQLNLLGDTIIKEELWKKHECSLFSRNIGKPISENNDQNWCGAGKYMLAVDSKGLFYPCVRFAGFSLKSQPALIIGDIKNGIDKDKLAPLCSLTRSGQSTEECMNCEVASGCAWCQGFNYDDSGILNHRATYICPMHKARVRANKRFWEQIDLVLNRKESVEDQ